VAFDHIIITLVHGTWARHTRWVQDDSRLCQQLRTRFGDRLHLTRFPWSGWNQASARLSAAKRLRVHLQKLILDHPEAEHFIIAHSHGGNVAMYALQGDTLEAKISGLVCFSTPFLHVYSREASRGGGETLRLGMLNAWPLFLIALLIASGQVKNSAAPLVIGLLAILGCLLFILWETWSKQLAEQLQFPSMKHTRLLLLRATGDEASAALGGAGCFSWLSAFPIRLVNAISARPLRLIAQHATTIRARAGVVGIRIALLGSAFVVLDAISHVQSALRIHQWLGPPIAPVWFTYLTAPLAIYVGLLFASLLAALLVPILLFLLGFMLLPFGWEVAIAAPFIETFAEATPPGTWNIIQLSRRECLWPRDEESETGGLRHSAVYDSQRAILEVTVFLSERLNAALREKLGSKLSQLSGKSKVKP